MIQSTSVQDLPWRGLEPHRADLERFLKRRCPDRNDVDDVVQESFIRAARYRGSLDSDARLRSWLMRIATNVLSDRMRAENRRSRRRQQNVDLFEIEGREQEPIEQFGDEEWWCDGRPFLKSRVLEALRSALPDLTETDRRLLFAYYRDRNEARTEAERAGLPPELLKVRLFRARKRLRSALGRSLGSGSVAA